MIHPRRKPLLKAKRPSKYSGVNETPEKKPLFLILQKVYFDQILEGSKNIEYRDHTKFYISRLIKDDKYRNYKTVIFQEGYRTDARRMTAEIKEFVLNGCFEIHLGEIIEKNF